ncbi:MAG: tetratricopeptide repeat protein [Candidatus Omnitrophica bacterium]|nr:tetratricopeptide repeat protein [Candidatus Omnitrophota bacterium]
MLTHGENIRIVFIIIFSLLFCHLVSAETIQLKSGVTTEGKIIELTDDHVVIDKGKNNTYRYNFNDVEDKTLQLLKSLPKVQRQKIDSNLVGPQNYQQPQVKVSIKPRVQQAVDSDMEDIKKAEGFFQKKDYDSAMPILNKLIERGSNNYFVYWLRGRCLDGKNNNDDALKDYFKALEINPEKAKKTYKAIAAIYLAKGDYDEAITQYNKYLMYFSEDGEAYYGLGYADFKKGFYNNCLYYVNKAASFNVQDTLNLVTQIGQMQIQGKKKLLEEPREKMVDNNTLIFLIIISAIVLYVLFAFKGVKIEAPFDGHISEPTFKGYDRI